MKPNKLILALVLSTMTASGFAHGGGHTNQKDLSSRNVENLHKGKKEIIVTIDDGPTPGVTEDILDSLKKYNVKATFFAVGSRAQQYPEIMARIVREGHIIGNHTMTHPMIGDIKGFGKKRKITREILGAHEFLLPYLGNNTRFYFRAPGASWQKRAADIVNKSDVGPNYYGPVLWDIGGSLDKSLFKVRRAADWGCWSKGWSVRTCYKGYVNETEEKKGGVVLFHDLKEKSAELIDRYLKEFSSRSDYSFVTMDEVQF
jgi:peptidoglycan/xylan/chitin deacetylase (PgdA/CDA1 family)